FLVCFVASWIDDVDFDDHVGRHVREVGGKKLEREKSAPVLAVFCCKFWNFLPASQSQPIVPGFAEAITRGQIFLVELVALQYLGENSFHGKIVGVQNRVSSPDGRGMMCVARRGHG